MPSKATNPQNLIPQNKKSPEERSRIARMGQVASTEAKRRKKTFREAMEAILEKEVLDKNGNKIDLLTAISAKQIEKAGKGDTKAFEVIRDTIGERPVDKVMIADVEPSVIAEVEAMVAGFFLFFSYSRKITVFSRCCPLLTVL